MWKECPAVSHPASHRIMANENLDEWKNTPAVYTETVLATKDFLDGEIAKYAKYDDYNRADTGISPLFTDEHGFRRAKGGVGRETTLIFLGKISIIPSIIGLGVSLLDDPSLTLPIWHDVQISHLRICMGSVNIAGGKILHLSVLR